MKNNNFMNKINEPKIINNHVNDNKPVLFKSKIKKVILRKNLKVIKNDTGRTRHYTPASQE